MKEIIDKLPSLLSERFLLAFFLPGFIFAAASLALANELCNSLKITDIFISPDGAWRTWPSVFAMIGAVAASYALSPFTALAREVLEGRRLPKHLRTLFARGQQKRFEGIHQRLQDAWKGSDAVETLETQVQKTLGAVRTDGPVDGETLSGLAGADKSIQEIWFKIHAGDRAGAQSDLRAAVQAFKKIPSGVTAKELTRYKEEFLGLTRRIAEAAHREVTECTALRLSEFPINGREATMLGNLRAGLLDYAETRYQLDFELFWSHLNAVKAGDSGFRRQIDGVENQRDFLVNMLLVSLGFAIWGVIIVFAGHWWAGAALLVATTIGAGVYWFGINACYRELTVAYRAALDLHRFSVLEALNQPLPSNLDEERALWDKLHRYLIYRHEKDGSISYASKKTP